MKRLLRELTPPLLWRGLKNLPLISTGRNQDFFEWEYIPQGWATEKQDPKIKGWNVESILQAYQEKWPAFLKNLEGTFPLGISPESDSEQRTNLSFHNIVMTYGYSLAIATRHKSAISMLDWGGGIGHYYLLSQKLIPGLQIEYHCKDVPVLAAHGQTLFPEAHFYTDETCLQQKYDFVLASTSLQYSEDWQSIFRRLADATADYLFVTRLPIVHQSASYVMVQRPYQYGYNTEYLGWCLNRQEFLNYSKMASLRLVQEFSVERLPLIHNAPEQPEHWGFLFQKEETP